MTLKHKHILHNKLRVPINSYFPDDDNFGSLKVVFKKVPNYANFPLLMFSNSNLCLYAVSFSRKLQLRAVNGGINMLFSGNLCSVN